jgi:hypothetical protein
MTGQNPVRAITRAKTARPRKRGFSSRKEARRRKRPATP